MTAVRLGESARYGLRLYAYVLGIAVLGGAGVAGGLLLALPEIEAWRGAGQADVATGVAGGVVLFLGLSILVVGWLSTAYKLLADGVARGRAGPDAAELAAEAAPEEGDTAVPGPDPNVAASSDSDPEPATGAGPDAEPAGASGATDPEDDNPPEPSPEEIAFGSSGDGNAGESDPIEEPEPEPTTDSSGPLPGQNASSDPLADPGDE